MTPEQFNKHLAQMQMKISKAVSSDIPKLAGNEAARLFRKNFQEEGFFGKRWKDVNRRRVVEVKTKSGKVKYRTRAKGADGRRKILTGRTANLGRSIKVKVRVGGATVHSDLPYSAAHNEGTNNAGRGHNTKIPKRQFIGEHKVLDKAIKDKIETTLNKIFNT